MNALRISIFLKLHKLKWFHQWVPPYPINMCFEAPESLASIFCFFVAITQNSFDAVTNIYTEGMKLLEI